MIYYISDPHFAHANIIHLCRRPFDSVEQMNNVLAARMASIEARGDTLVCAGDVAMGRDAESWLESMRYWPNRVQHVCVMGNHDRDKWRRFYARWFGTIVGQRGTWMQNAVVIHDRLRGKPIKLLVSHRPQADLQDCDLNLYGHVHMHENVPENTDYWSKSSIRHFNICVEALDYFPRTIDWIVDQKDRRYERNLSSA